MRFTSAQAIRFRPMCRKYLLLVLACVASLFAAENVKTVNGVARANVKTIDGVPIANIKTLNGVDNTGGGGPVLATDDFNRADGGLGANWTVQTGSGIAIVSNQAKTAVGSVDQFAFWNAASFAENQYSKVTVVQTPASIMVTVRASGTGGTFNAYWARPDGIHKHVNGSYTSLGDGSVTVNTTDIFELRATGVNPTTLRRYVNGVAVGTGVTDSDLDSGAAGIGFFKTGSDPIVDNWEGGDL